MLISISLKRVVTGTRRIICFIVAMLTIGLPCLNARAENPAELLARCAPAVHVETLGAIVRTESNGHVYVVSDDGPRGLPWSQRKHLLRSFRPSSAREAAELARGLIAKGHLVGMGLTQVNSQHLPTLGVSIEELFDECTNLTVGGQMLSRLYAQALGRFKGEQAALRAAISAYNTGNFRDGLLNGYVEKVVANARNGVPAIKTVAAPANKNRSQKGRPQADAPAPRRIVLPSYGGVQEPLIAGG